MSSSNKNPALSASEYAKLKESALVFLDDNKFPLKKIFPAILRGDPDVVRKAILRTNMACFQFKDALKSLRKDKAFIFNTIVDDLPSHTSKASMSAILTYAEPEVTDDKNFMVRLSGMTGVDILKYASDRLKNDRGFVLNCLIDLHDKSDTPFVFKSASQEIRNDLEVLRGIYGSQKVTVSGDTADYALVGDISNYLFIKEMNLISPETIKLFEAGLRKTPFSQDFYIDQFNKMCERFYTFETSTIPLPDDPREEIVYVLGFINEANLKELKATVKGRDLEDFILDELIRKTEFKDKAKSSTKTRKLLK